MASPTLTASATLVAGSFFAFTAPVGTPLPADVGASPGAGINAAFTSLGYTAEDGAVFKVDTQTTDLLAHQSFDPLRTVVTARKVTIELPLLEWTEATITTAFGGGQVTATAAGYEFLPPSAGELTEVSMVCDIVDGGEMTRIVAERGIVAGSVEGSLTKRDWATLPIVFTALAPVTEPRAWRLIGTNPALAPAS